MGIGNRAAIAALLASGLGLTACASSGPSAFDPKYPTRSAEPSRPPPRDQQQARNSSPKPYDPSRSSKRGGTWKPYQVKGVWYYPAEQPDYDETGLASWYGPNFDGKPTATGETFDMYGLSAAHKTLPLPSIVEVTNLDNGRSLKLRVNDRGPFVDGRIIDLSKGAAEQLGVLRTGLANVRVRYVGPAPGRPGLPDSELQYASVAPPPRKPQTPRPVYIPTPLPPPIPEPELKPVELAAVELPPRLEPIEPLTPQPPVAASPPAFVNVAARYEIQAGAFSSRANAERAASQLIGAGETEIREIERNGQILYRVFVRSVGDEMAAESALEKVSVAGYHDAVLRRLN